jgi:hypothetical protein
MSKYTRRTFLGTLIGSMGIMGCRDISTLYFPNGNQHSPPTSASVVATNRIVRAYDPNLNDWDYSSNYWEDYNNYDNLKNAFEWGLMRLSDTSSMTEAWGLVLSNYQSGDKVAIKMNMNCYDEDLPNSSPTFARAVTNSLIEYGIPHQDIKLYDIVRRWPSFWTNKWYGSTFNGVEIVDYDNRVLGESFTFPNGAAEQIPTVVEQANHIINLSLFKGHKGYVTGAMKNHFGTIHSPSELHIDRHRQIAHLNSLPFLSKQRLVVCEAALQNYYAEYDPFEPFQKTELFPNGKVSSIFLTTNFFIMDQVLGDFINFEREERGTYSWANEFLDIASSEYDLGEREFALLRPGSFSELDLHYDTINYVSERATSVTSIPDI